MIFLLKTEVTKDGYKQEIQVNKGSEEYLTRMLEKMPYEKALKYWIEPEDQFTFYRERKAELDQAAHETNENLEQ